MGEKLSIKRSHLFTHRDLNYEYQLHLPKLRFAKNFAGLQDFLKRLPDGVPEGIFEEARRCSEGGRERGGGRPLRNERAGGVSERPDVPSRPDQHGSVAHRRHNWVNAVALQALRLARHNRERHAVVEGYFLSCDRNTIATEVPVWFFDKRLQETVAGHIDLVQVNFGQVWILDYKPNASRGNRMKVSTQLSLYARGLAHRTGLNLEEIRCAWFDETDCYDFTPRW